MSWRSARSLDVLLDEINTAAPNRDKASDGLIGDPAHSSRVSDHNPNPAGVVRARDFTHDPDGGLDCNELAEFLVDLGRRNAHPALRSGAYVIWNDRIASDTEDGEPWDWEPYDGSNEHRSHLHLSVATLASGYDSTRLWGWGEEKGFTVDAAAKKAFEDLNTKVDRINEQLATFRGNEHRRDVALREMLKRKFNATDADLDEILGEVRD